MCSVNHKPTYSTKEILLPIWQRVLQRTSIRVTDNFFDLGGTPSSATQLFAEIADEFGRSFPAVTICAAPTIETLAGLLEEPTPPRIPPLLLLKAGTENPPVFITHGLGGDVLGLADVVGKIESRHPIYGMQVRGIDGIDEPFASIEERAQFYLDAIRQLQPHGPYFLIGYSLGGLAMLEVAQRLSADGEKIALLTLLDTYPDKKYLSLAQSDALISSAKQTPRAEQDCIGSEQKTIAGSRKQRQDSTIPAERIDSPCGAKNEGRRFGGVARISSPVLPREGQVRESRNRHAISRSNPTAVWAHLVAGVRA